VLGQTTVKAVLDDINTAQISDKLRAMLLLLGKVTEDYSSVGASDFTSLRNLGISEQSIIDALDVAYVFNIITRVADALGFYCGPEEAFEMSATRLLKRGYK
jgi:alkylhydroperoxidase family enzyme